MEEKSKDTEGSLHDGFILRIMALLDLEARVLKGVYLGVVVRKEIELSGFEAPCSTCWRHQVLLQDDGAVTNREGDGMNIFEKFRYSPRSIQKAQPGDEELGPLQLLPGTWRSLPGRGWNMIALPFADGPFDYRLLLNQYDETLEFNLVDKAVPNRGIRRGGGSVVQTDQFLVALDYEQTVEQVKAVDEPESGQAGPPGLPIHHEPGLWLHMTNNTTEGLDIARLATVPHGDSVLALGRSEVIEGPPTIPFVNGLPQGVNQDVDANPYLDPYRIFRDNPFQGVFDPTNPTDLLNAALRDVEVRRTTVLSVDTTLGTGGIVNIPFIVKQANAAQMNSIFWIEELEGESDEYQLQYAQVVNLDFFPRRDGLPGLIAWPHVSINTLRKVAD